MKKPVVDYREFRLSKINDPQFSHLKLLLGWLGYFAMYLLTERFIPAESCHLIHSRLDDIIPFCEIFVIPYVLWYLLIAGSLLYFMFYNVDNFKRLQTYIIIVQILATTVYVIYPSMQDLRPDIFPRDNFFTDIIGLLYEVDTSTGVCPSLHVAISLGIASAWVKEKSASIPFRAFIVIFSVIICLSTVFIKQHSIIDSFAALPLCFLAECAVFGKSYWLPKFKKTTINN